MALWPTDSARTPSKNISNGTVAFLCELTILLCRPVGKYRGIEKERLSWWFLLPWKCGWFYFMFLWGNSSLRKLSKVRYLNSEKSVLFFRSNAYKDKSPYSTHIHIFWWYQTNFYNANFRSKSRHVSLSFSGIRRTNYQCSAAQRCQYFVEAASGENVSTTRLWLTTHHSQRSDV